MLLSLSAPNAVGMFGVNKKAQMATQTVFDITRMHGDYLREGWKNVSTNGISISYYISDIKLYSYTQQNQYSSFFI